MDKRTWISFRPAKETLIAFALFVLSVLVNFIADLFRGSALFYVLYQGALASGVCLILPLWLTVSKRKRPLASIGITGRKWMKAASIGVILAAVSLAPRLISMRVALPRTDLLVFISFGLIMSTLFEEVFFRGFLQTVFERSFGIVPAVALSALCFSLYHLGYSNLRDINELVTLFLIGAFFSISFRITKNIITSYIVNLPHALLTFVGEKAYTTYLLRFNLLSSVISAVAFAFGIFLIVSLKRKEAAALEPRVAGG